MAGPYREMCQLEKAPANEITEPLETRTSTKDTERKEKTSTKPRSKCLSVVSRRH